MTDQEERQLRNELEYLKRENAALKRKFGAFRGRACVVFTAVKNRVGGATTWGTDSHFVEDANDTVAAVNALRSWHEMIQEWATGKPIVKKDISGVYSVLDGAFDYFDNLSAGFEKDAAANAQRGHNKDCFVVAQILRNIASGIRTYTKVIKDAIDYKPPKERQNS